MASHHSTNRPIPLHRGTYFDGYQLRDSETKRPVGIHPPRDYPVRPVDLIEQLREHGIFDEPTFLERVGDFFSSDRGISFMLGFLSGALFAVAVALVLA